MHSLRTLLERPHLSVITRHADLELSRIQDIIESKALVEGRVELEELFGGLLLEARGTPLPKTLDLIGHSTPGKSLLKLGDWVIDAESPTVTAFFREIAEHEVLPRLGVYAVRLLACLTAGTEESACTICALSEILGLEVFGATELLHGSHYDANGFSDRREYMLVGSSDLRRTGEHRNSAPEGRPYPRTLDVDSLPATPLVRGTGSYPHRIATSADARSILALVRRTEGAAMPGLLAAPRCEVLLPRAGDGAYHRAQVILDGEFIRVYPNGEPEDGVVFPVDSPAALRRIVDALPTL